MGFEKTVPRRSATLFRNASNSCSSGCPLVPPGFIVERAPQAAPTRKQSDKFDRFSQACRKPALKESPAPVVSTGSTGKAV